MAGRRRASACQFFVLPVGEKIGNGVHLFASQIGKAGHSAFAIANGGNDLSEIQARADLDLGWEIGRRTGEFAAMACAALGDIESAGSRLVSAGSETTGPGDVVRIDIDDGSVRVDRCAAPFRAAIETGKDHGFGADGEGNELAITAKFSEIVERTAMGCGSALCEQVFGEALASERSRNGWQRLFFCHHFAGNAAGRVRVSFEREKRSAGEAIEEVHEALLGDLRDGVDGLTVSLNGEQYRR